MALFLVFAPDSFANGRYPEANQLAVDTADPSHIVVRTTFGVLRSFDAGSTWTWICEESITPFGLLDEEFLITTQGRTAVALVDGIATAGRDGCNWMPVSGDVVGRQVIDIVGDIHTQGVAYAAVTVVIDKTLHGRIARSSDGLTWSFIGDLLPATVPVTIDVAPSRPDRLYLGVNDSNFELGFIDVSDDGGGTWTRHPPPQGIDSIYVSAVDPFNPDRVYVRATYPDTTLYVSEDSALTWTALYTSATDLKGFALSPDGRSIAVGGRDGLVILRRTDIGNGLSTFTTSVVPPVTATCLTWTSAGLFVCADQATDGFAIGLSVDEGQTFMPLLNLRDLVPARCPFGTTVARDCPDQWCRVATTIGASCAAPAPLPTSSCGCQTGGLAPPPWWAFIAATTGFLVTRLRRARSSQGTHPA